MVWSVVVRVVFRLNGHKGNAAGRASATTNDEWFEVEMILKQNVRMNGQNRQTNSELRSACAEQGHDDQNTSKRVIEKYRN